MTHPELWKQVPLMWTPIPNEYLEKGKKLKKLMRAFQARTIEIAVDYDSVVQWRRFIDNPTLELGL